MNFEYSEEQQLFRDSIGKYLSDNYNFEQRNKIVKSEAAFSADVWQEAADLGWLAIPFSEQDGGFEGSAVDLMVVFEELGKQLVVEPFMETLVLGGGLLRRLSKGRYAEQIEALMEGRYQCALAHDENAVAYSTREVLSQATKTAEGYQINAEKNVVYNAGVATEIIVSAMLEDKLALFLVPVDLDGCSVESFDTVDGFRAAEVTLENIKVGPDALMASGDEAITALEATLDEALLASAAEQVGMMRSLLKITIEYTQQRKQFGKAISSFQVLQHRMADMYIAMELTVSLMYATAIKLRDQAEDASRYASALKVKADSCAREVAHGAFQLHGAIATTDECSIGHYLKRVTTLGQRFGGSGFHLQHFIKAGI